MLNSPDESDGAMPQKKTDDRTAEKMSELRRKEEKKAGIGRAKSNKIPWSMSAEKWRTSQKTINGGLKRKRKGIEKEAMEEGEKDAETKKVINAGEKEYETLERGEETPKRMEGLREREKWRIDGERFGPELNGEEYWK